MILIIHISSDSIYLLVHLGWCLSVSTRLVSCSGFSPHLQMESNIHCTVWGKDLEWKGKHQGKNECKLLSILTQLENFCYQTWILTQQYHQSCWYELFWGKQNVIVSALSLYLSSPLLICVCPSLQTFPPLLSCWSLSNMFTCLILLHFNACIKFRAKFKDCRRCCLDHTVIKKKVLDSFVSVPLEKKRGKKLQLIQQPNPNLAT